MLNDLVTFCLILSLENFAVISRDNHSLTGSEKQDWWGWWGWGGVVQCWPQGSWCWLHRWLDGPCHGIHHPRHAILHTWLCSRRKYCPGVDTMCFYQTNHFIRKISEWSVYTVTGPMGPWAKVFRHQCQRHKIAVDFSSQLASKVGEFQGWCGALHHSTLRASSRHLAGLWEIPANQEFPPSNLYRQHVEQNIFVASATWFSRERQLGVVNAASPDHQHLDLWPPWFPCLRFQGQNEA